MGGKGEGKGTGRGKAQRGQKYFWDEACVKSSEGKKGEGIMGSFSVVDGGSLPQRAEGFGSAV